MNLDDLESKKFERFLVPEDTYIGKLYSIVNLGLQQTPFRVTEIDKETGEKKDMGPLIQAKVHLTFELQGVNLPDGRPAVVSQDYTSSLNEKSKLLPVLHALLGGNKEAEDFLTANGRKVGEALRKASGKAALITVTHSTNKKGQTYAVLSAVGTLPSKDKKDVTPIENPLVVELDDDNINPDVFKALPKFIQDRINKRVGAQTNNDCPFDADNEAF